MRPGQPHTVTIGPLSAASANIISTTTRGGGVNNAVVLNGTGTDGQTANNICQSQTPGGAGNLVLNGTLCSAVPTGSAVAYLASAYVLPFVVSPQVAPLIGINRQIYFTFAADESARTFTITGLISMPGGLVRQTEVLAGTNTSIATSRLAYYQVESIAVDAATAGALTVGRQGVATLDFQRQINITSAGNDTGITFTVKGTDVNGNLVTEVITGANATAAVSQKMFKTVTSIVASNSIATTITVGQTGVARSMILMPDRFQNPFAIGIGCTVTGTVNYDVEHTFDDFLDPTVTPVWFDNTGITGETTNTDGNYAFAVRGISLLLNSGTGSVKMTAIQSSW
jgi:hypothetical protein